jgi:hypothetical protein
MKPEKGLEKLMEMVMNIGLLVEKNLRNIKEKLVCYKLY